MQRVNWTIDRHLTLLEVSQWTVQPAKGLEDLITVGRIEVEAVQRLNSLAQLMYYLDEDQTTATQPAESVIQLTQAIAKGEAVEVELISATQSWLKSCTDRLRQTPRLRYQNALNRLVVAAEAKAILAHASQP